MKAYFILETLKKRRERLQGKAHGAQAPECTRKYMRMPSTAQHSHAAAQ
jgi:hypothetical protein